MSRRTFAILGASTPENRISTKLASRKTKIIAESLKFKFCIASVPKMHNGSLRRSRLIALHADRYVDGNATDARY